MTRSRIMLIVLLLWGLAIIVPDLMRVGWPLAGIVRVNRLEAPGEEP
jgi:hypothetical protein